MILLFHIFIFLTSCLALAVVGKWLIDAIMEIAKFLGWREFVVAFFIMSFASSLPNLLVGITSALKGIPELSFGEVIGGNVFDLTVVIALGVLLSRGLSSDSRMVQRSALFTIFIAVLPLLLILDGNLGRIDGLLLILAFFLYMFYIFSKEERFTKVYDGVEDISPVKRFQKFFRSLIVVIPGIAVLLLASQGIVSSAVFFAQKLNAPLMLVGLLIVGVGNALPETYFSIISARKKQSWMILGNLMGSIIVPATLVLGIVALIHPVKTNFESAAIARIALVISAFFFLIFVRSDRKISKKEAIFLLAIYFIFISIEILVK